MAIKKYVKKHKKTFFLKYHKNKHFGVYLVQIFRKIAFLALADKNYFLGCCFNFNLIPLNLKLIKKIEHKSISLQ